MIAAFINMPTLRSAMKAVEFRGPIHKLNHIKTCDSGKKFIHTMATYIA